MQLVRPATITVRKAYAGNQPAGKLSLLFCEIDFTDHAIILRQQVGDKVFGNDQYIGITPLFMKSDSIAYCSVQAINSLDQTVSA